MTLIWVAMIVLILVGLVRSLYIQAKGYGSAGPGLHSFYTKKMQLFYAWLPLCLFIVIITKMYILFIPMWIGYEMIQRKYRNDLIDWGHWLIDKNSNNDFQSSLTQKNGSDFLYGN